MDNWVAATTYRVEVEVEVDADNLHLWLACAAGYVIFSVIRHHGG